MGGGCGLNQAPLTIDSYILYFVTSDKICKKTYLKKDDNFFFQLDNLFIIFFCQIKSITVPLFDERSWKLQESTEQVVWPVCVECKYIKQWSLNKPKGSISSHMTCMENKITVILTICLNGQKRPLQKYHQLAISRTAGPNIDFFVLILSRIHAEF